MNTLRVAVVAGETSGDLLGGLVVSALKARLPNIEFVGIGGPRMIAAGVRSWFPMETLSVRGYIEALRSLPKIIGIRRQLKRRLLEHPPHLFIGIDAPDFNLGLEVALRKRGIRTAHVASPAVWGWRRGRIKKIRRAVDHMLVLFPFEQRIFADAGIAATYVGHPLADAIALEPDTDGARQRLKLPNAGTFVALLPGSRQSELELLGDLYLETAKRMLAQRPDTHFLVPLATRETRNLFEAARFRKEAADLPMTILFGHAQDALLASDVVLVASGTATLEAALCKKPMVITYRVPTITKWLVKARSYIPYLGLPNILAGRFIVPELLQEDATADNLAQALCNLLRDRPLTQALAREFRDMHVSLRQNMRERAADVLEGMLNDA